MDAQNPGARREMNELADLVGAIRLPTGAHRRAAGTEVVTDLLVFRRRPDGEQMRDDAWETVAQVPIDGVPMRINRYFDEHPEQMLGEVGVGHGMYDAATLTITTDLADLDGELAVAVDQIVFSARRAGLTMTERTAEQQARRAAFTPSAPELWDGSIVASETGGFRTVVSGSLEPLAVPKSAERELRALLRLRDGASRLLTAEAASVDDTPDIVLTRTTLRRDYLKYVGTYGALNRYTLRPTGRTNEDGEETFARIVPTPIRLLRSDPFGPLVLALEQFDDEDQSASPAAIMSHRVVVPRAEVQGVDSPADAIAVSLDRTGRIDITLVADLLGMNDREARAALGTLVFADPVTNQLTPRRSICRATCGSSSKRHGSAPRTTRSSRSTSMRSLRCCPRRWASRTSTRSSAPSGSAPTCTSSSCVALCARPTFAWRTRCQACGRFAAVGRGCPPPRNGARPAAPRRTSHRPSWSSGRCSFTTRRRTSTARCVACSTPSRPPQRRRRPTASKSGSASGCGKTRHARRRSWTSTTAASTPSCSVTTRMPGHICRCPAWRRTSSRARTSEPLSRAWCPSPPRACSTRSARARPRK
jgi:hypothetical protein